MMNRWTRVRRTGVILSMVGLMPVSILRAEAGEALAPTPAPAAAEHSQEEGSGHALPIDPALPEYQAVSGVSGTVTAAGSDTMINLMALWVAGFKSFYPNIKDSVEGKGSSTAPPALAEGKASFGPMSRMMKSSEVDAFEKRYGYKPTLIRPGIDLLAVYVHKDNPVAREGLTLHQLDAIFSKTRKGGHPTDVRTWGDLGLTGDWADKPISIYGRNSASGTYGFFKEHALFGGDYKDGVKEQPGSSSVVQGVASDRYGIGYSGHGYETADVVAVPVAADADSDFVLPKPEYVAEYPLTRSLYIYLNYRPGSKLDPLRAEFVRYVFSKQGQKDVVKAGYLPVSVQLARHELAQFGM